MKKQINFLSAIFAATILFAGCSDEGKDLSVKGVDVAPKSLSLKPGGEQRLTLTIFPDNAANKSVEWESSDESVATVDESGKVVAVNPGSAAITVTTVDGGEKATCSVTVTLDGSLAVSVSGEVYGTWEKYSVVNVDGQISVPAGKSLTIEEGVEVIVSTAGQDANNTKIEFIVNGSLYCYGTEEAPVTFTVPVAERTDGNAFARLWGGIIGSATCGEMALEYVVVEYTGAVTTKTSPSVAATLFKPAGGEGMVAFNTNNPAGKYVVVNSTFRNTGEDAIYVQGGSCIFAGNLFYAVGEAGGEAINVKAGCKVDAAFNMMYSPNTNGFKLSNSGADGGARFQAQINAYNNTVVNSGWRRDPNKPKGGSIWAEAGCLVYVYNNLIVNCMFAAKAPMFGQDATDGPDLNSRIDYNFYASGTAQSAVPQHVANGTLTAYDGFKPDVSDVVYGTHDVRGTAAGDRNPMFENFPFETNPLLSHAFNASWDFSLKPDSPALAGAYTGFTPYFAATGITVNGKTYKSPAPAAYFGTFGTK
ncbi:MAG: Ig-like domain-containing protein [Bacteroidales bacterium]|jgi:hypothetical protein|nr:Ig-like domain-containing protein [Bacteroidales bacterium]